MKKSLFVGKHNTVYIEEYKNGEFTLSDDLSDDTVKFDLEYQEILGSSLYDAIKHQAAEFLYMDYLYPVETFDNDGLYGA
ncbi:hypothetical protein POP12_220 [Pectobacterium phage POP12]|nr:hypothetical protein POP12_220 [Pectobacterium phage POP12]